MSNALKIASAFGGAGGNKSLYQIISDLGLTANLKLCLDAGDSASYDPAVQTDKWLDTSGGGYDFFRGSGTGSDAADPTFNGSAGGLSSNEYWSFDGGDWFTYDTTMETWMQGLSRAGAKYTLLVVVYVPNLTGAGAIFTTLNTSSLNGTIHRITTSETVVMITANTTNPATELTTTALTIDSVNIYGVSIDENGGASGSVYKINNGSATTFDASYTNPSTSGEGSTGGPRIGANLAGAVPLQSGVRLYQLAIWDTNLTSTNLTDLYNAIKGRFGL